MALQTKKIRIVPENEQYSKKNKKEMLGGANKETIPSYKTFEYFEDASQKCNTATFRDEAVFRTIAPKSIFSSSESSMGSSITIFMHPS